MWFLKYILYLAAACAGLVVLIWIVQTRLIFPTQLTRVPNTVLPGSAVRLEIKTADGERLSGVRVPPSREPTGQRSLVIGFGGNAWNGDDVATYLHGLFPEADVVTFHYRGYEPSTGRPSAAALLSDAPVIYDEIDGANGDVRVIAVGFSIGAGVAAHLASQRPLAGLILVTPFDTLEALASEHYPWIPMGWLLRHHISVTESLQSVTAPVAVISAGRDTIVPSRRTAPVRGAISNLVLDRSIADANHNDLYDRRDFRAAMLQALQLM